MKQKRRFIINLFDILSVLITVGAIVLFTVITAPNGKTVTVGYTLITSEGNAAALSEGDVLIVLSGGSMGSVTSSGDGYIEATAEAEYHSGQYYSGAVALKEGAEYTVCVGTDKFVCTLHGITER